jgi:uncharacterized protein
MADENPTASTPPASSTPSMPAAPSSDERTLGMLAHLLGILTWFIGALIIWVVKKDTSPFAADQAKEALNFQITMFIGTLVGGLTTCLGVGFIILVAVWVLNLVFCIIAAMAANNGQTYRYPFAIRLIK